MELEEQWTDLNTQLEGSPDPAAQKEGLKKAWAARQEQWDFDVQRLGKGFGSGISRIGNRNGKKAQERFLRQAWTPMVQETLELERLLQGRSLYQELVNEAKRFEAVLKQMGEQIGVLRGALASGSRTILARTARPGCSIWR